MIKINHWYVISLIITMLIALPILTVFISFFGSTSEYYTLLKNTFSLYLIWCSLLKYFLVKININKKGYNRLVRILYARNILS